MTAATAVVVVVAALGMTRTRDDARAGTVCCCLPDSHTQASNPCPGVPFTLSYVATYTLKSNTMCSSTVLLTSMPRGEL